MEVVEVPTKISQSPNTDSLKSNLNENFNDNENEVHIQSTQYDAQAVGLVEIRQTTKKVTFQTESTTISAISQGKSPDTGLTTIQNIYETDNEEENFPEIKNVEEVDEDVVVLKRNSSNSSRINKKAYAKLHRSSKTDEGFNSVNKLKGRFENKFDVSGNIREDSCEIRTKSNGFSFSKNATNETEEPIKLATGDIKENINPEQSKQETNTSKETVNASERLAITETKINLLQNNLVTKLSPDTIAKLKSKYSPTSFGFPQADSVQTNQVHFFSTTSSKIPVPTPRAVNKSDHNDICENSAEKSLDSIRDENKSPEKKQLVTVQTKVLPPVVEKVEGNQPTKVKTNANEDVNKNIEIDVKYDTIVFAEPEEKHFIVTRSSSEDSVKQVEDFFSGITMDTNSKQKKRSSSIRRIFSGTLFGKDKKKSEENKHGSKKKDTVFVDNAHNETHAFVRNSGQRHTVDNSHSRPNRYDSDPATFYSNKMVHGPREYDGNYRLQDSRVRNNHNNVGKKETNSKDSNQIGRFLSNQHPKQSYVSEDYVPMDKNNTNGNSFPTNYMNVASVSKYIDTSSSSSNTLELDNRNDTYENALIAQAEHLRLQIAKNENSDSPKSAIPVAKRSVTNNSRFPERRQQSPEIFRETPPRAQDTSHNVQLIRPKAIIPINTERPLPNPYQNENNQQHYRLNNVETKTIERNLNVGKVKEYPNKSSLCDKPVLEAIYGTVYDSVETRPRKTNIHEALRTRSLSPQQIQTSSNLNSPKSPRSLEGTKLRLPPNREKLTVQPRIKSPIPQNVVSADKIIATELLRNKSPEFSKKRDSVNTSDSRRLKAISPTGRITSRKLDYDLENRQSNTQPYISQLQKHQRENECFKFDPSSVTNNSYEINFRSPASLTNSPKSHSTPKNLSANLDPNMDGSLEHRFRPTTPSTAQYIEAAEWQIQQRKLAQPTSAVRSQTTSALIHNDAPPTSLHTVGGNRSSLAVSPVSGSNNFSQGQLSPRDQQAIFSSVQNLRSVTPVNPYPQMPSPRSPEKQKMLLNVEAYYWRELKKLKMQEDEDFMRFRQAQANLDAIVNHRSRSISSDLQNRGRRSLSLPRNVRTDGNVYYEGPQRTQGPVKMHPQTIYEQYRPHSTLPYESFDNSNVYVRVRTPQTIPEERVLIRTDDARNFANEQIYVSSRAKQNPSFIRNSFERNTIGPIGSNTESKTAYVPPIFKRGSLTSNASIPGEYQSQLSKKVSFSRSPGNKETQNWPAKNGYAPTPSSRNTDREVSMDDDVFLPQTPKIPDRSRQDEVYIRSPQRTQAMEPSLYENAQMYNKNVYIQHVNNVQKPPRNSRQPNNITKSPSQHERNVNEVDPIYVSRQRPQIYAQRDPKTETDANFAPVLVNQSRNVERRELLYDPRQNTLRVGLDNPVYYTEHVVYESPKKKVTVTNRVCDMYGQIHDREQSNYRANDTSGIIYGQLQRRSNAPSPVVMRSNVSPQQSNFIRGSRLTASANDMYQRYDHRLRDNTRYVDVQYQQDARRQTDRMYPAENWYVRAPSRPLPPIPNKSDPRFVALNKNFAHVHMSDTESGSEAGEVRRILQSGRKNNSFTVIGK